MPERRPPKRKPERRAVQRHPASNTPSGRKPLSPRVRRRRTVVGAVLIGLALIVFLFAFVYPTSTFLDQRGQVSASEQRLERIKEETRRLEKENKLLQGDAEVERLAREQYGLVRPGETPYVLVPAAPTTTLPPATTPTTTPTTKG